MPQADYHLYRHERRRRRWPYIVVAAVCVCVLALGWQVVRAPRVAAVTPGPDAFVKDRSLTVVLHVTGLAGLKDVRVSFDGADVTAKTSLKGDELTFATGDLEDGAHDVAFTATSSNLFRHDVGKHWRFVVDTSVPALELDGTVEEGRINSSPATFSGTTEPFSTVTVTDGDIAVSGMADATGAYSVSAAIPDGPSSVTIRTTDRAGNRRSRRLSVYVDAVPPALKVSRLGKTRKKATLTVRVKATDQLGEPKLSFVLDGEEQKLDGTPPRYVFATRDLAQGRHTLVVTAADEGGNEVVDRQTFVVDSSERFGASALWPGARGKDVKELQQKLADAGVFSGTASGVYDEATTEAVRKVQEQYDIEPDGLVAGALLDIMSSEIIVDLGDLTLYFYQGGKLVKTYPVATGQPAYPTPTGTFTIVNKSKDPTWMPPDSPWAEGAKPVGPGINNPLGTRWMGTSASGVGIHGVPPNEEWSIGSYASHGCIRMHNADAIELFELVVVGMPVIIRQ